MNDTNHPKVVSLSGAPIYRHAESAPWQAPQGEECIDQISDHIERYLGKIETVLHEVISDTVHIDVHVVKPSADSPFIRLVTSGMSDLPMTTPIDSGAPQYAELMMTLPANWQLDQKSFEDEKWYWPVRQLKYLARLPHKYQTWLGWGHSVPNGDPAEPFASGTKLCGVVVLPSVTVPEAFNSLTIDERKEITFYAAIPLYQEEMNLKLRSGTGELLKRFGRKGNSDAVSPIRPNVAKKRFGFL